MSHTLRSGKRIPNGSWTQNQMFGFQWQAATWLKASAPSWDHLENVGPELFLRTAVSATPSLGKEEITAKRKQSNFLPTTSRLFVVGIFYFGNFPNSSSGIRLCLGRVYSNQQINTCPCVCHTHTHTFKLLAPCHLDSTGIYVWQHVPTYAPWAWGWDKHPKSRWNW